MRAHGCQSNSHCIVTRVDQRDNGHSHLAVARTIDAEIIAECSVTVTRCDMRDI